MRLGVVWYLNKWMLLIERYGNENQKAVLLHERYLATRKR